MRIEGNFWAHQPITNSKNLTQPEICTGYLLTSRKLSLADLMDETRPVALEKTDTEFQEKSLPVAGFAFSDYQGSNASKNNNLQGKTFKKKATEFRL